MAEAALSGNEARQRLYEIVRRDVPFDEKAHDALELGKRYLGVDNGHLTKIDRETDHWEAIVSTDSADEPFPPGLELDLGTTYCRRTIAENAPIGLSDVPNQGWADDPAFETHGLHCYHGTTLIVDDEPFGTICFVAEDPRAASFSDGETMFAELLTRMLERELEREQHEADLRRQSNLATVLNRVLRHNLRNDMSVIRGFTELMADNLEDDPYSNTALSNIDKLIALCEKARELDRFVAADFEREPTDVVALLEDIVGSVGRDYPDASITLESDEEITAAVFPSLSRALEELIENAAKHGGDSPRVTVAVDSVPNAVEIRITDDGPGLAAHEADVLTTGSETPLTHGSGLGLWLAHWIVSSHDGSITPTTTEDGTSMTVSVPRKQTATTGDVQQQLTQLTRARDQYQAAFEDASDAMVIVNDDARILDANPAAALHYGVDSQKLLGHSLHDLHPDEFDFEAVWQELQTAGETRGTAAFAGPDGEERFIEYSADADIIPGQHLFISRDVTERVSQERELSRVKQRYETVLEAAPDPVFVADAETETILEVNEAAETLLGQPRDRLIGQHYSTFHPSADAELYRDIFERSLDAGETISTLSDGSHVELVTADGDTVPVEYSIRSVSLTDATVIVGIFRDVSARIEREQALEATTQRLQLALEGTDAGVWEWTLGTDDVRWTESLERLAGIEPGTFEGTTDAFVERIHPDDRQRALAAVEWAADSGSRFQTEYRLRCADDTYIWVESRGEIHDAGDGTERMVGIVTDVTERKAREAELIQKTEAMEKAPVGMTLSDPTEPDNPLVYANEHFCEITGYEEAEVIGRNCRFMQGPETDPETVAEIRRAIDNESSLSTVLRNYREDGTMFWNRLTIAPIRDEDGAVRNWVGFQTDVTERIEHEYQLELAETVFENTQDALFVIDVAEDGEFYVDRVNEIYEELTGLSNAEITGKTPTEIVGEEIGSHIEARYSECVDRRETIEYAEEAPVDGDPRQWQTKVTPVISAGRVDKLVGAMRDVTAI